MTRAKYPQFPTKLGSVLDAMAGPCILLDLESRILAANQAYREQYGNSDGLIGRTCYEVSHRFSKPCDQCGESCPRTRAVNTGCASRLLHLHYVSQGREYVDVELIPIRGADRRIRYFIEAMTLLRNTHGEQPFSGMVGESVPFKRTLEMIHRVAGRNTSVLLLGDSGTGKELAAQALHDLSSRAGHPFVPVDCSGMTESLFESELFGHEKGAFTGATQRKIGLVEASAGGTLFLDELGDMPLNLQVKLLRLLETGSFRRDLYYRIAAFPIELPPLRQRKEDLPLLSEDILRRLAPELSVTLSKEAASALANYDFPGNIRELRNILERAMILADGEVIDVVTCLITCSTLPRSVRR